MQLNASPRVPGSLSPLKNVAAPEQAETGCSPVTEIRDYKTLVRAAWRARDFNAVATVADKLLDKAPKTPDIARMRVKALLSLTRLQDAAVAILPIAGAEPQLALTVVSALVKAREIEPAARIVAALREAGATAGDNFSLLQGKIASLSLAAGNAAEKAGALDKARKAFLLGALAAPENAELQRRVSALRNAARNAAKGVDFETDAAAYVKAWESVLALDPDNVNAMKRLAVAAEKSGDHVAALDLWGRVLDCDPSAAAVPARLARTALHCGKEYDALLLLERVKRLGEAGEYADQLMRKVTAAGKALLRGADGFGASYSIALLMSCGGKDDEIGLLARKTMALLSADIKRALKARDSAKAAIVGNRMLDLEPANALALSAVGRYAYLMQDFTAAATYYDRLTTAEPDKARHWQALSRARARAGDADGARVALERAETLGASSPRSSGKSEVTSKLSSWMRKR